MRAGCLRENVATAYGGNRFFPLYIKNAKSPSPYRRGALTFKLYSAVGYTQISMSLRGKEQQGWIQPNLMSAARRPSASSGQ